MKITTVGNIVLPLCLAPFLLQCVAVEKDVKGIDLRTRYMDTRLVDLEKDVKTLKNKSANQADMGDAIDKLNTQMLQVQAQVDEITHQSRNAKEANAESLKGLTAKVDETNHKLENLQISLAQLTDQLNQASSQLNQTSAELAEIKQARIKEASERALAAQQAAEEAKKQVTAKTSSAPKEIVPEQTKKKVSQSPAKTQEAAKPKPTPEKTAAKSSEAKGPGEELYNKGIAQFNDKKYKEAYHSFSEYIEKYPSGAMAANARFWRGDALYNQGEYELAILEYQNVIADFSKHPKAPAALLKQGLAFEKLKEPDTAKIVYNKLLEEYPKSEQASAAKDRLAALK